MKKNILFNAGYQIIYILTQLIVISYASNVLGASGLGEYTLAIAYANYAILFAGMGMDRYASREIAYHRYDQMAITRIFKEIVLIRIITFSLISTLYYVLFWVLEINQSFSIKISIIMIFSYAFDISWLYMGLESMKDIVIKNCMVRVASVCLLIAFVKTPQDVDKCTLIMTTTVAAGNILLWKNIPKYIIKNKIDLKVKEIIAHLRGAVAVFIPEIAIQVYVVLDKVILGNIAGNYQLGLYESACKLVDITKVVQAAIVATTPTLAYYLSSNKQKEFKDTAEKSFRIVNFFVFPLCFGIMGIAKNLIPWFLGDEFLCIVNMIYLSSLLVITKGWSSVLGDQMLMVSKQQKYYTIAVVSGAIVDIILNIVFIFKYGAVGVLFATVVSEYIGMLIMLISVKVKLNFKLQKLFGGTLKYMTCAIIMGIIVFKVGEYLPQKILGTIIQIIIGIVIYTIEMAVMKDETFYSLKKEFQMRIRKWSY